jgi:hypothetical protein
MHQVVDVRVRGARRYFIDEADEAQHQLSMQEFRAQIPRSVRFVVGPGQRVQVADGSLREAGHAISASDLPSEHALPAWQRFEELVHSELIVQNYAFVPEQSG